MPPELLGPDKNSRAKVKAKNSDKRIDLKKGECVACTSKILSEGGLQLDVGSMLEITGKGMTFPDGLFRVCGRTCVRKFQGDRLHTDFSQVFNPFSHFFKIV